MPEVLLSKRTAERLKKYAANPGQALLLIGAAGSGKMDAAREVAAELLNIPLEKLESYPYYSVVSVPEDKREIPIELIRELVKQLKLQVPGKNNVRRVVVISDAHLMNHQAQNAFLKSLEEPAPGTVFILTASSKTGLLDTIISRTASVSVDPVSLEAALEHFKDYAKEDVSAAWALSQGAAGLLKSLLSGEDNELKMSVEQAKDFLKKPAYERLLMLEAVKDKAELAALLSGLGRVLKALYRAAAERQDNRRISSLIKAFGAVADAEAGLETNVLPRLVILKLVLSLPL